MPHYKDTQNKLHFIEKEYSYMLPQGCVEITDSEAASIRAPSVEQVKVEKRGAIKAERDRRAQKGGYRVGTAWFHSDVFSRSQQIGLMMLGANIPANLQWKTMDGSFVQMTQTLAGQVFAAAAASDQAIFAAAEAHRAAMEASATPETYDFSTGWPKVYGEA